MQTLSKRTNISDYSASKILATDNKSFCLQIKETLKIK